MIKAPVFEGLQIFRKSLCSLDFLVLFDQAKRTEKAHCMIEEKIHGIRGQCPILIRKTLCNLAPQAIEIVSF